MNLFLCLPIQITQLCFFIPPFIIIDMNVFQLHGGSVISLFYFTCSLPPFCHYQAVNNNIIDAYITYIIMNFTEHCLVQYFSFYTRCFWLFANCEQYWLSMCNITFFIIHCTSICIMDKPMYGIFHQAVPESELSHGAVEKDEKYCISNSDNHFIIVFTGVVMKYV